MNIKTKTILLFTATLISGIIIGVVGAIQVQKYVTNKRIETLRQQNRFIDRMERVIRPEPPHKKELRRLLKQFHSDVQELSRQFREQIKSRSDSLLQRAKPLLNEKQYRRLERMLRRKPPWMMTKRKPGQPKPQKKRERY